MCDAFVVSLHEERDGRLLMPGESFDDAGPALDRGKRLALEHPDNVVTIEHIGLIRPFPPGRLVLRANAERTNVVMDLMATSETVSD